MVTRIGKGPERLYHAEWSAVKGPVPGYLLGGPNASEMGFLAPGAPAKALLWDNDKPLRSGLPAHSLWHSDQATCGTASSSRKAPPTPAGGQSRSRYLLQRQPGFGGGRGSGLSSVPPGFAQAL